MCIGKTQSVGRQYIIVKSFKKERIDFMKEKLFEVLVLFNKVVLYTDERIQRNNIPEGIYCYDIRHGETVGFLSLADHVLINHAGSILCCEPFPPIKSRGITRSTADEQPIRGRYSYTYEPNISVKEYIERYKELTKKHCE